MATLAEEAAPLLHHNDSDHHYAGADEIDRIRSKDPNAIIIDFDQHGDPENPMDWPTAYKWSIVSLLAFMAFTVTFTCISVVPVANRIVASLNNGKSDKAASVLLVTIWELGEAIGPLFIAPLSEMYGRYPLMNIANIGFIVFVVLGALSPSSSAFIAARMLTGLAVATNVLNPAIVGDIFPPEKRGTAMSLIMVAPLIGGAIGPAIAGGLTESLGWRAALWMSVILAGTCEALYLCFFRETYKVVILRRRAARLRHETGNENIKTQFDVEGESGSDRFWTSIARPVVVFFGSAVLQATALFGAMTFVYFYIMSTTVPDILGDIYGLSPALTGTCFMVFSLGSFVSVVVCNLFLDRIYVKLRDSKVHGGVGQPEFRLPLVIFGAIVIPINIALYGWVPALKLPLPVFLVTLGFLGATMLFGFLPISAYVVDAFGLYSASAMTAIIITRCLAGTFLPLLTAPLLAKYGWGGTFSIFGGISLVLAPIPILLFKYGAKWRQRSVYSKDA